MGLMSEFAFPTMTALLLTLFYGSIQVANGHIQPSREKGWGNDKTGDLHDEIIVQRDVKSGARPTNITDCFP